MRVFFTSTCSDGSASAYHYYYSRAYSIDSDARKEGRYGEFGGQYVPEALMNAVIELQEAYAKYSRDPKFMAEVERRNHEYAGRPSPLYFAKRMTEDLGGTKVHIKREDLNHTGSHKINNVIGQCLLAKKMGKIRVIAETRAGQHGVATATMAAYLGLECEIFMGAEAFCRRCVESGVGYLMIPDLPFEERGSWRRFAIPSEWCR